MKRMIYPPFIERTVVGNNLLEAAKRSKKSFRAIAAAAKVKDSHLNRFFKTGTGIGPEGVKRLADVLETDVQKIYSSPA